MNHILFAIVVFCSTLYSSNALHCKFFKLDHTPAIPCDVCMSGVFTEPNGTAVHYSYEYTCFANAATADLYEGHGCKLASYIISSPQIDASTASNSGGICDHVTFKSFVADASHRGNSCVKQNQTNYFEFAFVWGCVDMPNAGSVSAAKSSELSCADTDSFELKLYSELGCGGTELNQNRSTIQAGCQDVQFNTAPIINWPFPNITYANNSMYFEITECGATQKLQWWVIALIACGAGFCCFCLCIVVIVRFISRRMKGINNQYVQTYGGEP